jgi:hypothetical protein
MKLFTIAFLFITLFISCKKNNTESANCFSDIATTRTIVDKAASISFANNNYYIVEQSTIDTRLLPCNLSDEFKVNGLIVTVSGEVKNTVISGACCTENFVITKIVK